MNVLLVPTDEVCENNKTVSIDVKCSIEPIKRCSIRYRCCTICCIDDEVPTNVVTKLSVPMNVVTMLSVPMNVVTMLSVPMNVVTMLSVPVLVPMNVVTM